MNIYIDKNKLHFLIRTLLIIISFNFINAQDGCGVNPGETGYKSSITISNCVGAGWTANNCTNCADPNNCIPYNEDGHPHDNAMDCSGVCLNEYNSGTYGEYTIQTYYRDNDGDGWGDPNNSGIYCSNNFSGYVLNNQDVNDSVNCASNNIDCNNVCDGTDVIDACGICGGTGRDTYYYDNDGDGVGNSLIVEYACNGSQPAGYVITGGDPDDNCEDEVYDGCGVCQSESGYKSSMTDANCIGSSWTANNCTNCADPDDCQSYHIDGHPNDNAMNCAGVCLNEYNDGTYEDAELLTYYRDNDGDGLGNPNSTGVFCSNNVSSGYVANDQDVNDSVSCASNTFDCNNVCDGSSEIDTCGVCGGSGTSAYYYDNDGDGVGNSILVEYACDGLQPDGYVATGGDPDDNCEDEVYDGCGVCQTESGYKPSMTDANCIGSSWTANNCTNCADSNNCVSYHIDGHPNDNAMDCAGVCLNEYNNGTYGEYSMQTYYLDSDGDGRGDPNNSQIFCSNDISANYILDDSDVDDSIFCESNYIDCNNVCDGSSVEDVCGVCGGSGRTACDTSTTTPGASCGLGNEYYCSNISGDEAANCYVVDDCGECNGPGIPIDKCDCNGNVNDCAGVCGGSSIVDSCGICGGPGTEIYYLDADNDTKVDTSNVVFACEQPTNYVPTFNEVDPDDNCTNEIYDGCGVCANIDGNGTPELGYLSTLSISNCQGSNWNAENCILDTNGDGLITTYNVLGHPFDNAMDCAGVCLNEFNQGTYGQAYIDSSYLDSDLDGWGDPTTGEVFCNLDGLSPDGRTVNNYDLDDDVKCEFISSAVDCAGNCKYLSDNIEDVNPEYIAEILLLTGCVENKPHLAGCDYCGVCSGSGRSMYFLDADNDAKADTSSFVYDCEAPDNYILDYDEVDPDDNCKDEVYDGCGVCADIDGNGTPGLGYLETMTTEFCFGSNWTAENCIMDTNQDSIITSHNTVGHPYDSGMDCAGICLNEYNDGTFGQATINTYYRDADNDDWGDPNNSAVFCSNNVSEGYILDSSDISDDVYCISNAIDCTKECFDGVSDVSNIYSDGYQNVDGECVFTVFPGDVDMDGKVEGADLDVIVNYWDQTVSRRNIYYDLEGEELESEYDWRPQYIPFYYVGEGDSCLVRADTNGDGKININDVLAIFINIDQSHNYGNSSSQCNLEVNPRENVDIYYNIYKSLPPSELRSSLARRFDFEIIPESFIFHGNYPNPFNPIANIDFEIPHKGIIGLYIYNLNGQLIFSETYDVDIGYHSYRWDASNYSSGIYFYELYFNNKMEISSKMILLK